jgi:hypothetical protein
MIRTRTPWVTLAAGLCIASHFVNAASQLTFTDKWADSGAYSATYQYYYVRTVGSFSVNISLPLNGVNLSKADTGTQFTLSIGPAGNTTQIVSDTLGDAEGYSPGNKSAKFPITNPNTGNTNGSVTVSWTATTISVTGSASLDALGDEFMFAAASDLMPTNMTLNTTTTGVYYEVGVTLDASDNGGGTYSYDNPYVPVTGSDKETEYNPPDGSGPDPLETGSVTGTGDFSPPNLTISSPAANFKVYSANTVIDLTGMASDTEGITNIQCFVNGNTGDAIDIDQYDELPTNKISWTAKVDLSQFGRVGSNLVTVIAQDISGNQASVSRAFYWIESSTAAVTVNPPSAGTVKGIENGEMLQVGSGYSVTATPASKSWIFSQWTDDHGDVLSSNATFEYIDTDGALIANFKTNFFYNTVLAGTYTGLFYDTNKGVQLDDAGYITVTVTPTGGYSGKLSVATTASPFSFSGQLAEASDELAAGANFSVKVSTSEYLNVALQVATDPNLADLGAGMLGGFVNAFSNPTETTLLDSAQIQGKLSLYKAGIVPGLYNIVISPVSAIPSEGPGGYSYGSANVNKTGAVAVGFNLSDGTSPKISFGGFLAQDGTCPYFASLYGGKGVILGWMQFLTNASGMMLNEPVNWVKMPVAGKFYSTGFNAANSGISVYLFGSLYVPPKAGTNVFGTGVTALTFDVDGGYGAGLTLPIQADVPVTYNPVKNTFTDTGKVTIALTPATGLLKGTFFPAGSKASLSFNGVEVNGAGYGFYSDSAESETGPIWIHGPLPVPAESISIGAGDTMANGSFTNGVLSESP